MYKGVSQEVQWFNRREFSTLNDVLTTGKVILCLGIDSISLMNIFPYLLTPPPPPTHTAKGWDPAMIHGASILFQSYSGLEQDSFVLCHDPVRKGITTVLCRTKPVAEFLLGDRKLSLYIIVVNRVPECVLRKLDYVRGGSKGNLMRKEMSMGRFSHTVRYTNPNHKGIQSHISGSTSSIKDGVCALLIDLDSTFSRVLLWVMQIISAGGILYLFIIQRKDFLVTYGHCWSIYE